MEGKETAKGGGGGQVLVLPWPIQGHISPMLQLSKRLASKGLRVTVVTTMSMSNSIHSLPPGVNLELISDKFDDGKKTVDIEDHIKHFMVVVLQTLAEVIKKHHNSKYPAKCLIYDSIVPGALDIAQELGLAAASFFTQSCAVSAIYYHARHGSLELPPKEPLPSLPAMPHMEINDLPSFVADMSSYQSLLKLALSRFSNFEKANWLLFNTFDKLEYEVVNWMKSLWPVKTIGPIIPSMYLDKRLEDDRDYGLSLFKPNSDACMKWLGEREPASVVYASFGSLAALREEQMEELLWGLKNSNHHFLWVVRDSEIEKLPSNFVEEMASASLGAKKGMLVGWCNQLQVLAHGAVGCFMTHCGWNSTLEALSLGVPMVAIPQWTDQTTNAKFVADVWGAGTRAKPDERGIVSREEVELRIREVMDGEKGVEIRKNVGRWKQLAKEAVDEGGSSDKNIEEFVAQLIRD